MTSKRKHNTGNRTKNTQNKSTHPDLFRFASVLTSSTWKVVIVLSSGGIFGDHSVKCSERSVTGVCFVSSVGWTTQLGPVRVCLGKERGRKKDRKGVRKDAPTGPLHIRNQGLIWNQTQPLSGAQEGMFKKKKRKTGRRKKAVLRG